MSGVSAFCPHCGYNLRADEPIVSGVWRITPYSVEYNGRLIPLTASQNIMLHSIAAAGGEPVKPRVLAERIDSNTDGNVVQVLMVRIRKALPGVPIKTVWNAGYRWTEPLDAHLTSLSEAA